MNESQLWQLADELATELSEFTSLKEDTKEIQSRIKGRKPDPIVELRAIGSILHDIYQGAENILKRIAKKVDEDIPTGSDSHRQLLEQMARSIPNTREEILRPDTYALLEQYLKFRHRFRHIYGFNLN